MTNPSISLIELRAEQMRLTLRPDLGASICGLWCGDVAVLRSTGDAAAAVLDTPRAAGGFVMAPYSNRVGFRRFRWQGQDHSIQSNFSDSPHAMHGTAWQGPWEVASQSADAVELVFKQTADAAWPFAFNLSQRLKLSAQGLRIDLALTSTDQRPQPAGLGWHPYFAKRSRSRLHIELTDRWEGDAATEVPTRKVAQAGIDADVAHLDYDNCFEGWRGAARIRDEKLSMKLSASVPYLVVFTPKDKPFYCLEPVSHVNNAVQMAEPALHGLRTVKPGETLEASFLLEVAPL